MRLALTDRRTWLTAGALSLALTAGLTGQLVPMASAESPVAPVAAKADDAPVAVTPSLAPESPAAVAHSAAPVAAPVAKTAPQAAAKPVKPATRPVTTPAKPVSEPRAASTSPDVCSGSGWQAARGRRALASLRHPTPAGVTVAFKDGRSGFLGLTYPARHHVDVFVRPCSSESWTLLRHVTAHEMGHAYDAAHMTAADRAAYMALRGIPASTPWFGCSYCSDFATPAGDFAETYAQWQRGTADSRTKIAAMPGPAALAALGARFFS